MRPNKQWHFLLITLFSVAITIPLFGVLIGFAWSLWVAIFVLIAGFSYTWYFATVKEHKTLTAEMLERVSAQRSSDEPVFDGLNAEEWEQKVQPRLIAKRAGLRPGETLRRVTRLHPIVLIPFCMGLVLLIIGLAIVGFTVVTGGLDSDHTQSTTRSHQVQQVANKPKPAKAHKKPKPYRGLLRLRTPKHTSSTSTQPVGLTIKPLKLLILVLGAGFVFGGAYLLKSGWPQAKERWWTYWIITDKRFFKAMLPPESMPVGDDLGRDRNYRLQGTNVKRTLMDKQMKIGYVILELAGRDENVTVGPIKDVYGFADDADELIEKMDPTISQ
jgi:hypothetical protein